MIKKQQHKNITDAYCSYDIVCLYVCVYKFGNAIKRGPDRTNGLDSGPVRWSRARARIGLGLGLGLGSEASFQGIAVFLSRKIGSAFSIFSRRLLMAPHLIPCLLILSVTLHD